MTIFKIHESYLIRHEILKSLFSYAQQERDFQKPKNRISLSQISTDTKILFEKLLIYHELLHEENEINCSYDCDDPNHHSLLLETKGRQSYIYEKYLKDGHKETRDNIKDKVAIFSPLLTVIIALASLTMSLLNYTKTSNQQDKINSLENSKTTEINSKIEKNKTNLDSSLTIRPQKVIPKNSIKGKHRSDK